MKQGTAVAQARIYKLLIEHENLCLPDAPLWHPITPPVWGEVNGIPSLRGKLIAANGSLGILLRAGEYVHIHTTHFIPDREKKDKKVKRDYITDLLNDYNL